MPILDSMVAACLVPLAILILVSSLDDLVLDLAMLYRHFRKPQQVRPPSKCASQGLGEKRIAVFLPLWREHRVIVTMVEHNIAAIRYQNYDFFVGTYPNDQETLEAVQHLEQRFDNVHRAVCPHDGPTSKGDCLNWIYQQMLLYEEERALRFDIVVTHDAEDLIHPEAFRWINYYAEEFDMVQIPVLPLPTPFRNLTHGVYCDEFAEYQTKDVPVRHMLGGFVPSNGVGTGYSRRALEGLAETANNRVFEPGCLTEDYENGLRLHSLGYRQIFVPIRFMDGRPLATREYFPLTFRQAVRQRTRWIIGIALQTWERYGWCGGPATVYWFWRDRKGLLGNPVNLAGNGIFVYGGCTWLWSLSTGSSWGLSRAILHSDLIWVLAANLLFQILRLSVRMGCTGRIYGWRFSLGVPVRTVWANWINSVATIRAAYRYAAARLQRLPLVWLKTEHLYPSRQALARHKRRLGEVLTGSQYLTEEDVADALSSQPAGLRLGEYLIQLGKLTEHEVYEALSLQQNLPIQQIEPHSVSREAKRILPVHIVQQYSVLPFKVADGCLYLAGPEIPTEAVERALCRFTRLEIRFLLITPADFARLREELL